MGRHAAPSEDEPDDAVTTALPAVVEESPASSRPSPAPRGRHAVADDEDDVAQAAATERLPALAARKDGGTAADWRMLRSDSALRNRVIAAVIMPFVLFFIVLAVIGRMDAFAVWIWLPLISAGIGAGVLLDRAHARANAAERQAH